MSSPGEITPQEFALATLDFLRTTDAFYRNAQAYSGDGFTLPGFGHQVAEQMVASRSTINHCIRALGGLPLSVTDESGASTRYRVDAWVGHDPDPKDAGNLVWHIQGMPPDMNVSVNPSAIDEMRAEFMPPNEGTV